VLGSFRVYDTTMKWRPVFYMDREGNESVKDFVLRQSDGAIAEILHVFKLLRDFNITLGMPYVRKIDKSGLRELRVRHGSDIYRIFFFASTGRRFVLLHAILKKEDKTPEGDKELAIQRMDDHKSRCIPENSA
jgi:phage-related protein